MIMPITPILSRGIRRKMLIYIGTYSEKCDATPFRNSTARGTIRFTHAA